MSKNKFGGALIDEPDYMAGRKAYSEREQFDSSKSSLWKKGWLRMQSDASHARVMAKRFERYGVKS